MTITLVRVDDRVIHGKLLQGGQKLEMFLVFWQ